MNWKAKTKEPTMNAKTLEAVRRHGETLLAAFPNATEKDPVALCKKLRRIENSLTKPLTDYCNGNFDAGKNGEKLDEVTDKALDRVTKLLGGYRGFCGLFVNRDPRGYALKVSDNWTREFNAKRLEGRLPTLYTDMGGYGIIAPDLTPEN